MKNVVQFTCIEEFGVGDTIAPRRKHRICKTINPDTTYINLRPDIFSIIVPIVILTYLVQYFNLYKNVISLFQAALSRKVYLHSTIDQYTVSMNHNIILFSNCVFIDTVTIVLLLIVFADNKKRHKSQNDETKITAF